MKKIYFFILFTAITIGVSHSMSVDYFDLQNRSSLINRDSNFLDETDLLPEIKEIKEMFDVGNHESVFFKITSVVSDIEWLSYDDLKVILEYLILLVRNYNFYLNSSFDILMMMLKENSISDIDGLNCLMFFLIQKGFNKLYPIAFDIIEKKFFDIGFEYVAPILYALVIMRYKPAVEFFNENIVDDADNESIVDSYFEAISSFCFENKIRTLVRTDSFI